MDEDQFVTTEIMNCIDIFAMVSMNCYVFSEEWLESSIAFRCTCRALYWMMVIGTGIFCE